MESLRSGKLRAFLLQRVVDERLRRPLLFPTAAVIGAGAGAGAGAGGASSSSGGAAGTLDTLEDGTHVPVGSARAEAEQYSVRVLFGRFLRRCLCARSPVCVRRALA